MTSAHHSWHYRKQALKKLHWAPGQGSSQRQLLPWRQQQALVGCQRSQGELQNFITTLVELQPHPLAVISLEAGQVLLTNRPLELLLHLDGETAESDRAPSFFARSLDQIQLSQRLQTAEVIEEPLQLQRLNGEVVDVLASAKAVTYQGQPAALLLFYPNVVKPVLPPPQKAEDEWQKFAALVEHSQDFIAMSSLDGSVLYVNQAGRQLVGLETLAEAQAHSITEYLPQDDLAHFCEVTLPILQTTGYHASEGKLCHFKTGDRIDVHRSCFAVKHDQTGETICLATIQRNITVQKRAEMALRESEERFRAIAETLPEAMVISRITDGTILYANPQVESTFGLSPTALMECKALEFYADPADRTVLLTQIKQDGCLQSYEVRAKKANGTPFWVAVSSKLLTFNGNAALVSVFHDVTHRKQTEARLQAIAQQQVAIAALGQQALAGSDLAALMAAATTLIAQTLDVPYAGVFKRLPGGNTLMLEAGLGWQADLVGAALVNAQSTSPIGAALLTRQPVVVEDFPIDTRFSGPPLLYNHRVVSGVSVAIPGQEHPFGVLGAYTTQQQSFTQDDVHFLQAIATVLATAIERKQAEERLHLMERAIAASSNGIVLTDANQPDDPIIYVNPAFEKMTGYTAAEVLGRNCRFLQGDNRDQPSLKELRSALQEHRECHVTLQNYRKDGSLIWNELYVSPVFDPEGYLTHFIGIQTDITERKLAEAALREQEEQYRRIVETATEGIWVLDQESCTSFVNQQMTLMLGYSEDEMLGKPLFAFMDDEGITIAKTYLARRREGIHESHDFKFRRKDGTDLWALISTAPFFTVDGQYAGALGMLSDITERKQAEDALRKSEEQFRLMFELAPIGIALNSLDGHFLNVNQALCQALGYSSHELLNHTFTEISHADDLAADLSLTRKLLQGEIAHFELEKRYLAKDGSIVNGILHATLVRDVAGNPLHMLGQVVDITDRKRMEKQLIYDAFHDALTGLHNRVLFMDRLQRAITRSQRSPNEQFAVLFLDLDRFKLVNDSLGHLVGDQLLITIAQRLQACLRNCDTLARLGGDEFAILLEPLPRISDATAVAERIQQALSLPLNLDGYEIFTTASIGIALSTNDYDRPDDLLRDADTAMYRAKEQGKACYALFDAAMYNQTITRLHLETDLRWAIEREELRVHYQAIVSLETGQINGFEALVRWQHPTRGLISPVEFIPVAEETGLIVAIGEWVLQTSCQQICQWQAQFPTLPLTISVNLSSKQLSQPNLVQQIDQILQQTGLAPERLKLELTESSIMQNAISAAKLLAQLKLRKIQLCIDDFGTGYSSLSRLHQFPIDTLKVDRSFVNLINASGENTEMVEAIVALAHSLGMDVVAEGVETAAQLDQLKQLHCEYGQGYLFSKPLNQDAATALLASVSA